MSAFVEQLTLLFESDLPDPHLVLREGTPSVVSGPDGADQVLDLASRADLLDQYGGRAPSGRELEELAARLESAAGAMGA